MQSKYQRKREPGEKRPNKNEETTEKKQGPEDVKNLYKDIEKSKEEQEREKLKSM